MKHWQPKMPYQGIATFLGSPFHDPTRKFAFLGLPYDCATSFRSGARLAPNAIRQASLMLTDGDHPIFGVDPCQHVTDCGDAAIPHVSQSDALIDIEKAVIPLLKHGYVPLLAGGDHLVTLGILRAVRLQHGKIGIIHFDAHCDTWPSHFGDKIGHGTWLRHAINEGLVNAEQTIQIGIRSPVDRATRRWLGDQGGTIINARSAMSQTPKTIVAHIKHVIRTGSVYLTFDIDAIDPAYAPGTGTPEIGGLTTMWVQEVIELLGETPILGMDVVEVAPAYDHSEITALAAATLFWSHISASLDKKIS